MVAKGLPKDAAIAELFAIGFAGIRSGNRAAAANAMQQMAALMEEAPVNGARSARRHRPARPARHRADRSGTARGSGPGTDPVNPWHHRHTRHLRHLVP